MGNKETRTVSDTPLEVEGSCSAALRFNRGRAPQLPDHQRTGQGFAKGSANPVNQEKPFFRGGQAQAW
jgi:hypothetical protein